MNEENEDIDYDLTLEVNQMLKNQGLCNVVHGIRKKNQQYEWALDSTDGLVWFPLSQACLPVEKYLRSLRKV